MNTTLFYTPETFLAGKPNNSYLNRILLDHIKEDEDYILLDF